MDDVHLKAVVPVPLTKTGLGDIMETQVPNSSGGCLEDLRQ